MKADISAEQSLLNQRLEQTFYEWEYSISLETHLSVALLGKIHSLLTSVLTELLFYFDLDQNIGSK